MFFSRITLEDVPGTQYEPYIFAALNSAKVMIVVGTSAENLNAVWVKNEWIRYLAMMRKDKSKLLIPCYRDMDAYDLPEALSVMMSYDMGKIGFIQDLIRGVNKVLDAGKAEKKPADESAHENVIVSRTGANTDSLLKRGYMALDDEEWDDADEFFEQVLNMDAECAEAYLGKFLADERESTFSVFLAAESEYFKSNIEAGKVRTIDACEKEFAHIDQMSAQYAVEGFLSEDEIKALYDPFDFTVECKAQFAQSLCEQAKRKYGDENYIRAKKFADEKLLAELQAGQTAVFTTLDAYLKECEQADAEIIAAKTAEYAAFIAETDEKVKALNSDALAKRDADAAKCAAQAEEQKKNAYEKALSQYQAAKSAQEYNKAAELFDALENYKDSAELAKQCLNIAQQKKQAEKKKTIVVLASIAAVIAAALLAVLVLLPALKYKNAEKLLAAGDYEAAAAAFENLGDYKDSAKQAKNMAANAKLVSDYAEAEALYAAGNYDAAIEAFEALGDYKDSAEKVEKAEYAKLDSYYDVAEALLALGDKENAAIAFGKIADHRDARERSFELWSEITNRDTVSAGIYHTVGLKADGTVVAVGSNNSGECDVSDWKDIVEISAGAYHTVGLKADGTVLAVGDNHDGQCNVSEWTDIVAISAGKRHTVGLKVDGTAIAVGNNDHYQCNVSKFENIIAIAAGENNTIGLVSHGKARAAGWNTFDQCDVSDWKDIVAVSVGRNHTVGLKADGTAVAAGLTRYAAYDVSDWTDIIAISANYYQTIGLKSDGTVVATKILDKEAGIDGNIDNTPFISHGQSNVSEWQNIVAISTGEYHTVGLRADGTVVSTRITGDNAAHHDKGQTNVSTWTDIKLPG